MSWFKKSEPATPPDLAALRAREQELLAKQHALEAEHLDAEDIERSNQLLEEINDLNAQVGVLRDRIGEFPSS